MPLPNSTQQVIIQGITGKEGQKALEFMRQAKTNVVAGVTPGKGGQEVDGVPVFNTIMEAKSQFPQIEISSIFVPPAHAFGAIKEAVEAELKWIHVFAEGLPSLDTVKLLEMLENKETRIIGPSSIGLAIPGVIKLGSIGGKNDDSFLAVNQEGGTGVAILSKSGGMSNEIANLLSNAQIPQSLIVGIGGDRIAGSSFADFLPDLIADPHTDAIVLIGEIGGAYEEMFAQKMTELDCKKPVVAFISGMFAETLPEGVSFGHAGAVVSKNTGTRLGKIAALKAAGAKIAAQPNDIVTILKEVR